MRNNVDVEFWHYMLALLSSFSTLAHNHHHFNPCLEYDSLSHQVYTRDWDNSITDNQSAPQTASLHALMVIIGFTLER